MPKQIPSLADSDFLTSLEQKASEIRKIKQDSKPLSVQLRHIEPKLTRKRKTPQAAKGKCETIRGQQKDLAEAWEQAIREESARQDELSRLEEEMAATAIVCGQDTGWEVTKCWRAPRCLPEPTSKLGAKMRQDHTLRTWSLDV